MEITNVNAVILNGMDQHKINTVDHVENYINSSIEGKLSGEEITKLVSALNENQENINRHFSFEYNEKIRRIIFRVIDHEKNEIIREYPEKDAVTLLERINDYLGKYFDKSV